jgi:hypothetical protein
MTVEGSNNRTPEGEAGEGPEGNKEGIFKLKAGIDESVFSSHGRRNCCNAESVSQGRASAAVFFSPGR